MRDMTLKSLIAQYLDGKGVVVDDAGVDSQPFPVGTSAPTDVAKLMRASFDESATSARRAS